MRVLHEGRRVTHRPVSQCHSVIHCLLAPTPMPGGLFFSSLAWEVLSRNEFQNTRQAQAVVLGWCYGFYNHERRHSSAGMMKPINYENTTSALNREAA